MVGVSGTGQYTVSESSRQNLRTRTPYRSCFIFFVSTNILKKKNVAFMHVITNGITIPVSGLSGRRNVGTMYVRMCILYTW